jgi:hypothetical protein
MFIWERLFFEAILAFKQPGCSLNFNIWFMENTIEIKQHVLKIK